MLRRIGCRWSIDSAHERNVENRPRPPRGRRRRRRRSTRARARLPWSSSSQLALNTADCPPLARYPALSSTPESPIKPGLEGG